MHSVKVVDKKLLNVNKLESQLSWRYFRKSLKTCVRWRFKEDSIIIIVTMVILQCKSKVLSFKKMHEAFRLLFYSKIL